jgi:tRNA nucleotidyltransferase (CCA-adding enzyme)
MVGNVPEGTLKMPGEGAKIEPERIGKRLRGLGGLERVREAAGDVPVFLVGGAVRDLLLGRDRTDLDVAVEGDAADLGRRLGGEITTHERFATATVVTDNLELDLATARAETYPRPGALPEVRPATLAEDLARRDFTVNAMAVPLQGEPELIDPHGGVRDLERGLLRVLHERSFADDPTRALRAARYAARYGFALEPDTERGLRSADLETVSRDRVDAELRKLAAEPRAGRGFELLSDWGLLPLAREAAELVDRVGELAGSEPWAPLVGREDAVLAAATGRGLQAAHELASAHPGPPSEAAELARGADPVTLALARALGAEWLDRYVSEWREVRLDIAGDDLLAAGIPQGPAIGRGLAAAMRARLDGEATSRAEELEIALGAARAQPR